ncbi:methyltransferase domain-containing protein [Ferruginibacter sp. HRS2-29]|uniref:methyltransferase domain-containing protein n=1 Tax=Ferruginibacter sp. HRS2-29 TaxID=2487334 RepID=UPI0020CC4625|nr:methyltransferase domain-containing protein [Ferruginibacter sp. HRS2-29]MCP9750920.1 methyltransferase domain-containing protein [Ferruginibacter sp. HRS2-29]
MLKQLEKLFRIFFPKHLPNKNIYLDALHGAKGIEIGGPSPVFTRTGLLPVYKYLRSLDGCNFSDNTVWEGKLDAGETYRYSSRKPAGLQYIAEGNDLAMIADDTYDTVLSSHNLEHFANPVKALYEWKRIMKNGGYVLLILPNKEKTFDHRRPVTKLQHMLDDYAAGMPETDTTHFEEVIALHDVEMDLGIESKEALTERTWKNTENRCVHHHVFDASLVKEMLSATGFELLAMDLIQVNIFALARSQK